MNASILLGAKSVEGSIKYNARHSLIPAAQILDEAQAFIYQRLRVREMQSIETISLAIGDSTAPVPTGYLAPIKLEWNGFGKIRFVREDDFPRDVDSTAALTIGSPPSLWTVFGSTIYFDCQVDEALTGRLWCFKTPAALAVTSNETNFLTDRFPTILRRACLAFSYESRNRADAFHDEVKLVEAAIEKANQDDEMSRHGQEL